MCWVALEWGTIALVFLTRHDIGIPTVTHPCAPANTNTHPLEATPTFPRSQLVELVRALALVLALVLALALVLFQQVNSTGGDAFGIWSGGINISTMQGGRPPSALQ